ncbi:MAG: hypothetical protein MUP47_05185 [Phycisphaerae bacterium]|nr:hypothetical protein [Phycisphaerae bacterium]
MAPEFTKSAAISHSIATGNGAGTRGPHGGIASRSKPPPDGAGGRGLPAARAGLKAPLKTTQAPLKVARFAFCFSRVARFDQEQEKLFMFSVVMSRRHCDIMICTHDGLC